MSDLNDKVKEKTDGPPDAAKNSTEKAKDITYAAAGKKMEQSGKKLKDE